MNQKYRIAIGADHKGVELKEAAVEMLKKMGYEVEDVGPNTQESCDYADYANAVCKRIADGRAERGILICFSGLGMSIAANRWKSVRATLVRSAQVAALSRQHNDANVMCLASAFVTADDLEDILHTWLAAEFEGGRHVQRLLKASGSPLAMSDPELAGYIEEERQRQNNNIELIASENFASPAVMIPQQPSIAAWAREAVISTAQSCLSKGRESLNMSAFLAVGASKRPSHNFIINVPYNLLG